MSVDVYSKLLLGCGGRGGGEERGGWVNVDLFIIRHY